MDKTLTLLKALTWVFEASLIITIMACLCGITLREVSWTPRMERAHEIAEIARGMGLSEDDPIIVRASAIWWEDANAKAYITDWPAELLVE